MGVAAAPDFGTYLQRTGIPNFCHKQFLRLNHLWFTRWLPWTLDKARRCPRRCLSQKRPFNKESQQREAPSSARQAHAKDGRHCSTDQAEFGGLGCLRQRMPQELCSELRAETSQPRVNRSETGVPQCAGIRRGRTSSPLYLRQWCQEFCKHPQRECGRIAVVHGPKL